MASEKRQKAIDLSHHLSDLSRARQTSPLKGLAKYFGRPGLISLAGGKSRACLPWLRNSECVQVCRARHTSPSARSVVTVSVDGTRSGDGDPELRSALIPDSFSLKPSEQDTSSLSWFWKLFGRANKEKTNPITIPKYVEHPAEEINLSVALQYGTAQGLPQLQKFLKEFVDKVYQPAYDDCTVLVHTGNTDG